MTTISNIESLQKLSRDVKVAVETLSPAEVRYLVTAYYQMQENRKVSDNQTLALTNAGKPHEVVAWLAHNNMTLERNIKSLLDAHTSTTTIGRWSKSIVGIGPVIAAGLSAHINIEKAPVPGHIWSFAGLSPLSEWKKGEKRPWNAELKTLCWKIGESFVKFSNHPEAYYGPLWKERKQQEEERNEKGLNAPYCEMILDKKRFNPDTDAFKCYRRGVLPPAHVHARSKRWVVKLFLSHWHYVMYSIHYGKPPAEPYAISVLGHAHKIPVPNWPMV